MTYDQLRDIIIERTTALTKCKYQNDINQKKLLEAQAQIAELRKALEWAEAEVGWRFEDVLGWPDDTNALAAHDAELINDEARNPWKRAIIDAAVVNWTLAKEHESDPRAAVNALLDMCAQMALDPLISSEAAELIADAKKAALLEAAEWFADVEGYAETGRDIVAAQTLRHMAEGE